MTKLQWISIALALMASSGASADRTQQAAPDIPYVVVGTFPHDSSAFTQGLDFRGERLFESTGRHGESTLRRVDLVTGEVLRSTALSDTYFGEGTVILDRKVFWVTWQEHEAFVYRPRDFKKLDSFTYKGEGWGLTTDGSRILMSNGTSRLRWRDPDTFKVLGSVEVTDGDQAIAGLNELEWVEGAVFANVFPTDRVARIDPDTGDVTGWLDLSALHQAEAAAGSVDVTNGIAYLAADDRLFVTGKYWSHVYEIELSE